MIQLTLFADGSIEKLEDRQRLAVMLEQVAELISQGHKDTMSLRHLQIKDFAFFLSDPADEDEEDEEDEDEEDKEDEESEDEEDENEEDSE